MYNIGICDDGQNTCASLEDMILAYMDRKKLPAETKIWYTGEGLCRYLEQGNHLDILFLDIELFKLSGIQVGDFIRNRLEDRGMQIIYISGKSSYAQALFKTQPMDFLIKPLSREQIEEALALAIKISGKLTEKFEYQLGKDHYYIPYGEIVYFSSQGRKIKIATVHGEKEFYGKIKELILKLPEDFLLIHQSYVVNKRHVARYTYEMVELMDGTMLTVSKVHRKQIREYLLREG